MRTGREVTAGPDGLGRMERILLALVVLLSAAPASALPAGSTTLTPSDRKWEPFGLANRVAVRGDLADPDCPSVTLLRLHANTRLPPHSAPVDRTYVVLSGTVHVGIGKKWDDAKLRTLPAGSFWLVPANTSTFEWNEDEVVCEVTVPRAARACPSRGTGFPHAGHDSVERDRVGAACGPLRRPRPTRLSFNCALPIPAWRNFTGARRSASSRGGGWNRSFGRPGSTIRPWW